jgi:hypothetical protein
MSMRGLAAGPIAAAVAVLAGPVMASAATGSITVQSVSSPASAVTAGQSLTLTVTPSRYALGQTVTLSGTDTGENPDGTTQPLSGQQIEISGQPLLVTGPNPDAITATTDASGHYSVKAQAGPGNTLLPGVEAGLLALAPAAAGFGATFSPLAPVTIEQDPTRITNFSDSPRGPDFGQPVTISGDVSFGSGGSWLPVASQPVNVSFGGVNLTGCPPGNCSSAAGSTATAADGSFAVTVPGSADFGTDQLGFGVGGGWLAVTTTTFDVHVKHVPTALDILSLRRDIHGKVHVQACINPRASFVLPRIEALYPAAKVQYAAHRGGPWRTLPGAGALRDTKVPPQHPGFCYRTTQRSPPGAVYYRIGAPAAAAYTAATSAAATATGPARTRIKDLSVRPRTVRADQGVRVSGQLFSLAYVKLQILFRPGGGQSWRVLKQVQVTGDNGNWGPFAATVVPPGSGDLAVRYPGQTYVYPYQTRAIHVTVR